MAYTDLENTKKELEQTISWDNISRAYKTIKKGINDTEEAINNASSVHQELIKNIRPIKDSLNKTQSNLAKVSIVHRDLNLKQEKIVKNWKNTYGNLDFIGLDFKYREIGFGISNALLKYKRLKKEINKLKDEYIQFKEGIDSSKKTIDSLKTKKHNFLCSLNIIQSRITFNLKKVFFVLDEEKSEEEITLTAEVNYWQISVKKQSITAQLPIKIVMIEKGFWAYLSKWNKIKMVYDESFNKFVPKPVKSRIVNKIESSEKFRKLYEDLHKY